MLGNEEQDSLGVVHNQISDDCASLVLFCCVLALL